MGDDLAGLIDQAWAFARESVFKLDRIIEAAAVVAAVLLAFVLWRLARNAVMKAFGDHAFVQKLSHLQLGSVAPMAFTLLLIWTAQLLLGPLIKHTYVLDLAASLIAAWVVIRIAVSVIRSREIARLVAFLAWTVAALNIVGLLTPIATVLDTAVIPLGDGGISLLDIITGITTFALLIWGALVLARLIDGRIQTIHGVPPSARVLMSKTSRIVLLTIAVLTSLNASGINLTALAVLGGALSVGIGFGLQKVVGNFISGLILLMDRSIKPGDVIEVSGTYGIINKLAARYTSVITRDGTEYLIPNEDMITQPVINWSHSDLLVRRKVPLQVSYESDLQLAMSLMAAAAMEEDRVLKVPEPRTLLRGFGESGVDLELRFWINDPQNGVANISSAVMMRIWDKFHAEGISFPYPHMVVDLRKEADE
ncbi:mechanosensitive ion channel family protein [Pseudokordiimonas caeni]|uniref:mechanosensitive ion channel family protein n=1 Tax=Pseudokordiimonas caeni TaxID=2997908 RepID=UPI00281206B2|nr:mechanosensitive ion channel domain-containing protein [Pseudokordiimonas caeni]